MLEQDTIAAIATPVGKGGIGVIRISGTKAKHIGDTLCQQNLAVRHAHYGNFTHPQTEEMIDQGISIYFKAPHSFTGEDVVELQAHGGPIVLDNLLTVVIQQGARMAKPGEFSERAFLNNKIDLIQAEAIADLINSTSQQAAKNALRSLQGDFSKAIQTLLEKIIHLRMYVEAAIDFPEEEVDFLSDNHVASQLNGLIEQTKTVFNQAKQGQIIRDGITLVIAGRPNAGKSSLLNVLAGYDAAIVTPIAGTTRDVLREHIQIDGIPLHIIDTAGLHSSDDIVEQEGIKRAWQEIEKADCILMVVDSSETQETNPALLWPDFYNKIAEQNNSPKTITIIQNKADISKIPTGHTSHEHVDVIAISAKQNQGIEALKDYLKNIVGFNNQSEGSFTARRRHLDALEKTLAHIQQGQEQLAYHQAGELLAEDLRLAQDELNTITGEFTPDDLLGEIFSSFCIGK